MKLSEFRSVIAQLLDDESNARWTVGSTTFDRTKEIDYALELALDQCLTTYAERGGGILDEETESTTTSAGVLDLSSVRPAQIISVLLKIGSTYYPIKPIRTRDYETDANEAKTIRVRYVRTFDLDSLASTATVEYGASGMQFPLFDHWICVTAANYLATKTGEVNPLLVAQQDNLEKRATDRGPIPTAYTIGRTRYGVSKWYQDHYQWKFLNNTLVLSKRSLFR